MEIVTPLLDPPFLATILPSFLGSCSNSILHPLAWIVFQRRKFLLLRLKSRSLVIYVNKNRRYRFGEGRGRRGTLYPDCWKRRRRRSARIRCFHRDSREFVRPEKLEHAIYGRSSSLINRTGTKQFFIQPCFSRGLIITEERNCSTFRINTSSVSFDKME